MALSNGILATAVLKLFSSDDTQNLNDASSPHHTTSSSASLDDPVCHWWDGFIRFGKDKITIRDVLSHRAGLHAILPHDLTLSALSQCETMISLLEDAVRKIRAPGVQERLSFVFIVFSARLQNARLVLKADDMPI